MAKDNETSEGVLILRDGIYQSNPLIQARKDFDIVGMRMFFLGLQGINPRLSEKDKHYDEDFKPLFIPTSKLTEIFGNTKYLGDLKKACRKLFDSVVELDYSNGGFRLVHMFEELEYRPKEGLYLQFSRKMRPYILDLFASKGYTKLSVKYLFRLSSPYAVRLLELLLQYQNVKTFKALQEVKRKLTLDELRFALNVPEGAYESRIGNFRKFVLDDPIGEISERTPYVVRYNVVKEGRKVVAFEFTLDTFSVPVEDIGGYKPNFDNDAVELLRSLGFTAKAARSIFKQCTDVNDCFSRVNRARALLARQKEHVKNQLGFLRKAIIGDWQMDSKTARSAKSASGLRSVNQASKDMPPPKKRDLRIGRKKMPYSVAKTYMEAIRSGNHIDLVNESLKDFNVTIAQFEELCKKRSI